VSMRGMTHSPETRAKLGFNTKVTHALKNPNRALASLNYDLASGKLIDFAEVFWPVIEPGRKFVRGWAIEAICDFLEAVSMGHITKGLINVPPGFMKSLTTNVLWPAWEWGPRNRPDLRYVGASYSQDLTIRDNRRCRQIIESDVYQEMFGDRFHLVDDQNAKVRYDTDKRGFKIATSVGGLSTGERGDRFVIDDPHNVKTAESEAKLDEVAQWFTEVVPTRVNDINLSVFLAIMQRVHERDMSGLALAAELGYVHLCIPMEYEPDRKCFIDMAGFRFEDPRTVEGELAFPERFDRGGVDTLKKTLSSWGGQYAVSGQLQQSPTPRGGGMFKVDKEAIKARMVPVFPAGGMSVRGWDIAGSTTKKSPYTASVKGKMVGDVVYIGKVTRERKEIEEAEAHIVEVAVMDGNGTKQDLPQDPGSAGKSQKRHIGGKLAKAGVIDYVITPESGDKETRAIGIASMWNNGNVVLVGAPDEAWVDPFLSEVATFPRGEYKDQVDALSRMYSRLLSVPQAAPPQGGDEIVVRPGDEQDHEEQELEDANDPMY
jgi:predicted phage terminase large subunit-like protein